MDDIQRLIRDAAQRVLPALSFHTHYIPSARGHRFGNVKPTFHTDQPLDPGAKLFAAPDAAWSSTTNNLVSRVPANFAQGITRIPVYGPRTTHFDKPDPLHPEHPANDPLKPRRSYRLPRPPPDYVW